MRILGIDPGLKATGYGIIDFEGNCIQLIETGSIEPKQKDALQNRIHRIYKNLDAILLKHQPQIMVLEKLYAHYNHPTTACILGHVRGVICLLCAKRNITLIEYAAKRIRKAVTGNGNAPKLQTRSMVAQMLRIDEEQLTLDASDALALALGHTHIIRSRV